MNIEKRKEPEELKTWDLDRRITSELRQFKLVTEHLASDLREMRERFRQLEHTRKTLLGCRTWDEYCREKTGRTRRAINYLLAGGNPVSKRKQKEKPELPEYKPLKLGNVFRDLETLHATLNQIRELRAKPLTDELASEIDSLLDAALLTLDEAMQKLAAKQAE